MLTIHLLTHENPFHGRPRHVEYLKSLLVLDGSAPGSPPFKECIFYGQFKLFESVQPEILEDQFYLVAVVA